MWEDRFSLTRILPYKHRIVELVLIRENPTFSYILSSIAFDLS